MSFYYATEAQRAAKPHAPRTVAALVKRARPIIRQYWGPDSCIASTRLACIVLRQLGLDARPIATRALVFNQPLCRRIGAHVEATGAWPPNADMLAWQYEDGSGCWGIGLGFGPVDPRSDGYAGHLCAFVEGRWLVDLSLDQAERPYRGIFLEPLAIELCPAFVAGAGRLLYKTPLEALVAYERHDEDEPGVWQASRDWIGADGRHRVPAQKILDAVRCELALSRARAATAAG